LLTIGFVYSKLGDFVNLGVLYVDQELLIP